MAFPAVSRRPLSLQVLANFRLFVHWLKSAKVVLALFMLVGMVYLILVPLYRMLQATVTFQDEISTLSRRRGWSVDCLPLDKDAD